MEGQPPCEVRVIADIAKRSLLLLSMENEEKVDHVDFGHTYYGTDVLRSCVLFNQSPDPVSFVVILEEDGEGQELVRHSLLLTIYIFLLFSSNMFLI